jgi:hypothetical protein
MQNPCQGIEPWSRRSYPFAEWKLDTRRYRDEVRLSLRAIVHRPRGRCANCANIGTASIEIDEIEPSAAAPITIFLVGNKG